MFNYFIDLTMNDISEILRALLDENSRTAEAEQAFLSMLENDSQLNEDYKLWCEEYGYDIKSGYQDYIDEQLSDRDEFWENMSE